MVHFSINLSTIFTEVPFLDRFRKAKGAGFSHIECQFPYVESIERIKGELERNSQCMVLINLPPGDWEAGDRGLAVDPVRIGEFQSSVEKGIEYAVALNVPQIHCMAGVIPEGTDLKYAKEIYVNNIQYAARKVAQYDLTLLIEPINPFDMPDYYLSNLFEAAEIIREIGLPNVKLQFDFYHIQRMMGNLLTTFEKYYSMVGHVQIADVPGRHQPGTGEINYTNIFQFIDKLGYQGFIGLEYIPKGKSEDSFQWLKETGIHTVSTSHRQ